MSQHSEDELAEQISKVAISESLSKQEQAVLNELQEFQEEHNEVERKFLEELKALKKKYRSFYEPLYTKRQETLAKNPKTENGTAIPNFWLGAMKNHQLLRDMIETVDEPVLAYLQDIQAYYVEEGQENEQSGFGLRFKFVENPYFEPLELNKMYNMEATDDDSEPVLCSTDCTTIQWKQGHDITKKTVTRKQKNKRTKQVRKLTETKSVPSFFNFFVKHEVPTEEELDNMNEAGVEELEVMIEADYEAGVIIRDKIIPRAVDWFTGEAVDSDMEMDSEDMEDDIDMEDDMDDDDEDDDDEEDDELKRKGKKDKQKGKKDDQNCKQQ